MKIPYYTQQRIIKRSIDLIMVVFLIITIFPIFWMVFCSFKSNTEILLGKIPFGRANNDAVYVSGKGANLFVLTADGGLNKFNLGSKQLIAHDSIKSMSTSYVMDDRDIWASTSDKGLVEISADNFSRKRFFKPRIKNLDINKVASTFLVEDGKNIWFGLQQKGLESIFRFDKDKRSFAEEIALSCNLSPFQITSAVKNNQYLWIGTNKGLIRVDLNKKEISAAYNAADIGLPPSNINKIILYKENLLLATAGGVFEFSPRSDRGKILRHFGIDNGLLSNRINSLFVGADRIFVGTNNGLSVINERTGQIKNIEKIFTPVAGSKGKSLVSGDIYGIAAINGDIYLGSSAGRVSGIDMSGSVKSGILAQEGHILVRWRNYIDLWKNIDFGLYLRNSLVICGITMLLAMIFATLAAYALARFNFPGNKFFSIGVLATQMIPAIMYLIPIYIMFTKFTQLSGVPMKGTYLGLILIYSAFFIPFSIWILRGFFAAIPVELEEAARIDGCSSFQVFWHIVLPLAVPGIVATGIYVFLTAWDELMFAWVLCNANTMTIPVGIRLFVGNYQNRFDLMMAAATVATIPVMILFFMLQRHIVKGLTAGAVKG